jgi:hypothetical protein
MKMRMTRRGAGMLIALMLIAVPAAAAVMTQTFVKATASLDDTCFDLEAGSDVTSFPGLVTFDPGPTIQAAGGNADLVAAEVTVKGQVGDRVIYTDVAFFSNDCGTVTLRLLSASDPAGGDELEPAVGPGTIWEDVDIYVYVENTSTPSATSNPVDDPSEWEELLSVVDGSVTESGSVIMNNGTQRRLAFVIDTSSDFVVDLANPANNQVIWRWTAQASYS